MISAPLLAFSRIISRLRNADNKPKNRGVGVRPHPCFWESFHFSSSTGNLSMETPKGEVNIEVQKSITGKTQNMKFPQDLTRFIYWIFFKPISLYTWISQIDPTLANVAHLLTRASDRSMQGFKSLALFYILVMPWVLAVATGLVLSQLGTDVNWLRLIFTLSIVIALSLTFSIQFCIALLLPSSVTVALWSTQIFSPAIGVFFCLMLGLAYGLEAGSARWGLIACLVYGVILSMVLDPLIGLSIGAAFLIGYFRIIFYVVEAPLSWILATLAQTGDALKLWSFHPVLWDELIWFPLPGLDQHLRVIQRQNELAAGAAIHQVRESFRQGWAVKRTNPVD
jgi:hypothetical protein